MGLFDFLTGQTDPDKIFRDMQFQQSRSGVRHAGQLGQQAGVLGQVAQDYRGTANQFFDRAGGMLDPNSQYNQSVLGMIQEQNRMSSADRLAQTNLMAQRNRFMSGAGNSGIGAANVRAQVSQAGEQLSQQNLATRMNWMGGMAGRAGQVANIGAQAGGLGMQASGQQANLMGMQSQAYQNADASYNQMMANAAQGRTQSYISNRQNQANFVNSLIGGVIPLAANFATGGMSGLLGAAAGG